MHHISFTLSTCKTCNTLYNPKKFSNFLFCIGHINLNCPVCKHHLKWKYEVTKMVTTLLLGQEMKPPHFMTKHLKMIILLKSSITLPMPITWSLYDPFLQVYPVNAIERMSEGLRKIKKFITSFPVHL